MTETNIWAQVLCQETRYFGRTRCSPAMRRPRTVCTSRGVLVHSRSTMEANLYTKKFRVQWVKINGCSCVE